MPDEPSPGSAAESAVYADMSRLNNELATAERGLIKANLLLDRANRELQALYETLPVGIFRTDATGRIEQSNGLFDRLTGSSPAVPWLDHVHQDDRESVERSWQETIDRGVPFDSIHRQVQEGEPTRYVAIKALSLRKDHGEPAGLVGIVEDVSELRAAQERQRQAERLTAIQHLTGGLAHNLNNILAVILSSAEQLSEDLPREHPLQQAARMNMAATEQAALLTRRLMTYAGQSLATFARLEVDSFLMASRAELGVPLGPHHALTLALAAPGAAIEIAGSLLRETVSELISNAAKAMPGGGTIRLATALAGSPDRPSVTIAVADTGVGMDETTRLRATDPFFTTREIGQGFGLGLSLADGAARTAGGTLVLASQPGRGTTVTLRFPLAPPAALSGERC